MNMEDTVPQPPPMEETQPKSRRPYVILLAALLIAMLIVSLILVFPFLATLSNGQLVSSDWSGFIVASDLADPQPVITGINGSWIVPTVNVSASDAYSAVWIGIGGQYDDSLIQIGTEQDSLKGQAVYTTWYELFPENPETLNSPNITQEDHITASIILINPANNTWSIQIQDTTNGQTFQKNPTYPSSRLSAEWIVERPTVGIRIGTLANFGRVTFTQCTTTINGATGTINAFPNHTVTMVNRQNINLVHVSSLTSTGSSFTIDYLP